MFTGLIQALGTMQPLGGDFWQITCTLQSCDAIMQDLAHGDSVAVDGVCLTVEQVLKDGFIATASPETLRRTTLGQQQADRKYVNLEPSLKLGSKIGGHFVMGHVDGTGKMLSVAQTATSWEMIFATTEEMSRYIVPKGSIAVNGISLTVAQYQPDLLQFKVAVIPVTYEQTNLRYLRPGNSVNLEGDILGKYVEKFLYPGNSTIKGAANSNFDDISPAFLAENGYL